MCVFFLSELSWCGTSVVDFVLCRFLYINRCQMFPIIGNRYKCAVRQDFDLCESCQETDNSPFPYLKVCLESVDISTGIVVLIFVVFPADQVS